jgi:gamma-tubulin complex component 2
VPPFIEGWKHKILLAGKYLNVIRECGIDVRGDNEDFLKEEMDMDDDM